MLELELLVLKKQTNPSFEAHRKISRGLWEKAKKKKSSQMSGLRHLLQYAFQILIRMRLVWRGVVEGVLAVTAAKAGWIKGWQRCVGDVRV